MNTSDPEYPADLVQYVFDQLVDLTPTLRAQRLQELCADNPSLMKEVGSLLSAMDSEGLQTRDKLNELFSVLLPPMHEQPVPSSNAYEGWQFSHYKLLEKIGSGGMGAVYKAVDTRLERPVAIKLLSSELSFDPEAKERFILEARAASRLDHINICTIYEIAEIDEHQLCIVMAYYDGETLRDKTEAGRLAMQEAMDIAIQLVQGLVSAHASKIVHRDIKPANIMITREGIVKILDFGIAKVGAKSRLTKTGSTLGTAAYMSPEQFQTYSIDHRSDIWACGVVLYEMLTGVLPFKEHFFHAMAYAIEHSDPKPINHFNAAVPDEVEQIVRKCLEKHKEDRYQTTAVLLADLIRADKQLKAKAGKGQPHLSSDVTASRSSEEPAPVHIYVSYDPQEARDKKVGEAVCDALGHQHTIYTNNRTSLGARWVDEMQTELSASDYLIIFISNQTIASEMVLAEIELAHRLASEQGGRPIILPIRLEYDEPYAYPLNAYLDDLNWAYWKSDEDMPRIIEQLQRALTRGNLSSSSHIPIRTQIDVGAEALPAPYAAAQVTLLEAPEGTMDAHSRLYVLRPADDVGQQAIRQQGVTITIKGPRQMGKSSLLVRMMDEAMKVGKQVLFLDFQLFNQSALEDADTFFKQFCVWLTFKLKLENRVEEYWQWPLGNSQCCTLYVEDCILKELGKPLVLAMDEVERMFETRFRSDFFGMLRSWHNERAKEPVWKKLDLALVTSTEPYQLIENLNQSPFNVGEIIDMRDFSVEQVRELNRKHGTPLSIAEVDRVMTLLNGQPYLTRKALYLVASQRLTLSELLKSATSDKGPFGDHLRYHLFRLHGQPELREGLKEIIHRRQCYDEAVYWRLQGAGLVLREGSRTIPRCTLYEEFFRSHLDG